MIDCIHQYSHGPTVRYTYYLMGLMNIRWMDIVLRYMGRINPAPLAFTVVNSIPYDLFTYESTLRRYLSLPQTVLKQMVQKGWMMRSEEYAREFLTILRKDGNRTNMYENVDGYLKDKDRQTIYMHQFFMYGNYSDQYNRLTLAYLLVMEAVLDRRHVWFHLDQNTYYCQIEEYHTYMWRNRWRLNTWLNIFMDSEINQAMVHPKGPRSRQYFVNDPADMGDYLREFEHTFMLGFGQIFFFQRLAPFQVLSLKDLSRCMIFLNFFIKRISLIFDLGLTDQRDLEKPIHLEQYPRYLSMLASQMGLMNQRTIEKWTCQSRYTSVKKSLTSECQRQLIEEYSKAIVLSPMYTCSVMKLGDDFRTMLIPMFDKFEHYGMNIYKMRSWKVSYRSNAIGLGVCVFIVCSRLSLVPSFFSVKKETLYRL